MHPETIHPPIDNERIINARLHAAKMQIVSVGCPNYPGFPVILSGDAQQTSALLNLIYWREGINSLGIINLTDLPKEVDPNLANTLNENKGILAVNRYGKATIVVFIESDESGGYILRYGYSQRGTSIIKSFNVRGGLKVDVVPYQKHYQGTLESLVKLSDITGSYSYIEALKALIYNKNQSYAVDPERYYAMLGLDPYALALMSPEEFITRVNAIKKALAKAMHPDVNQASTTYNRFAMLMEACTTLGRRETLLNYSVWIQNTKH